MVTSFYKRVCKKFNEVCKYLLNRGFSIAEKRQIDMLKNFRSALPRRESERRNHPLSRHCEILSALETRMSMLNMTFNRYITRGFCCFIPGKILDEILYILNIVENSKNPPETHKLLLELRDISSMAMEYFEEKIAPAFIFYEQQPQKNYGQLPIAYDNTLSVRRTNEIFATVNRMLQLFQEHFDTQKKQMTALDKKMNLINSKFDGRKRLISHFNGKLREKNRQNRQIENLNKKINDLNNKVEVMSELLSKLTTNSPAETNEPKLDDDLLAALNTPLPSKKSALGNYVKTLEKFIQKHDDAKFKQVQQPNSVEHECRKRKMNTLILNVTDSKIPRMDQTDLFKMSPIQKRQYFDNISKFINATEQKLKVRREREIEIGLLREQDFFTDLKKMMDEKNDRNMSMLDQKFKILKRHQQEIESDANAKRRHFSL